MKNFNSRFLTSIPLILISFVCIYLGKYYLISLVCLVFLLIYYEWNYLFFKKNNYITIFQLFLILLLQISYFYNLMLFLIILSLIIVYIITINYFYKYKSIYSFTSFYFLISLFSIFSLLQKIENYNFILIIFISVISFDVFSYLFGTLIKGKKLIPKISPGKTISGLVFGSLLTFIIMIMYNSRILLYDNYLKILFFTFVIIISAILGDILESYIKRKLLIKDTSNFLPGHGGFFDRFDSFLLVFITLNILYPLLFN